MKAIFRKNLALHRQQQQTEGASSLTAPILPPDSVSNIVPEVTCPSSPIDVPSPHNSLSLPPSPILASSSTSLMPLDSPSAVVAHISPLDFSPNTSPIRAISPSRDIQTLLRGATYRRIQAEHEAASYYSSSTLLGDIEEAPTSPPPSLSPLFPIPLSGEASLVVPQPPSPPFSSLTIFTLFPSPSAPSTATPSSNQGSPSYCPLPPLRAQLPPSCNPPLYPSPIL